jgi:glyoxylase-like metal-dependent hydrolase (beta-lactamase superfamily II)
MFFRQIEVGYHSVFAYLIGDPESGEAVVVDPADDVIELIELARRNDLRIQSIVNTHGHVDHIMGNAEMKENTGARIIIHAEEADYLEKIGDFWLRMFNARKSPPADEVTEDGASIWVGSHEWQVLHTPGHTPGGICLYNAAQSMCLTGDTLFVGSVGRIDGPKASGAQLLNSIRTKLLVLPDDTTIFPGHNYGITPSSSIGIERVENPFVNGQWDLDEF